MMVPVQRDSSQGELLSEGLKVVLVLEEQGCVCYANTEIMPDALGLCVLKNTKGN